MNVNQTIIYLLAVLHDYVNVEKFLTCTRNSAEITINKKQLLEINHNKFFQWELNVPNAGVVLAMGILGEIQGIKIVLGTGTNLRDTKYLREHILQEIT